MLTWVHCFTAESREKNGDTELLLDFFSFFFFADDILAPGMYCLFVHLCQLTSCLDSQSLHRSTASSSVFLIDFVCLFYLFIICLFISSFLYLFLYLFIWLYIYPLICLLSLFFCGDFVSLFVFCARKNLNLKKSEEQAYKWMNHIHMNGDSICRPHRVNSLL